ncbi:S1 RNA-binding domain-containing protein [Kitasatospora sp. NPDC052868]|uniref:S1 RNA-binding domain-containing protein n=1 Tax=Kitasatospora sp. NPDC052868 TaxID=3364060 RepID=UPI0037C872CF
MSEYSWPDDGIEVGARAKAAWSATCQVLPVGTRITGEVIGRRPFGVFLRIDHHPDAVGLAEITAMPRCATLPHVGEQVSGEVIWHADHNHQVKVRLTEWTSHEDLLPQFAARIGQIVTGHVTKLAPIGAFVRLADCVEGLVPLAELSDEPAGDPAQAVYQGKELPVRILNVDLERRRIELSARSCPADHGTREAPGLLNGLAAEVMVQRIMDAEYADDAEVAYLLETLGRSLGCPSGHIGNLIFCPDGPDLTAAEVVAQALGYRPFAL